MANEGTYDVFLSFRGEDTRHSFTGFLYDALCRKGFHVFMDDVGLEGGDQISESLVNAIEQSRISMVVLSENYASSTWCLDELIKILDCMRLKNQMVWPIFYKVAPSDVRHQRNTYWEDMAAHEEMFGSDSEKVQKWRSALSEIANLKGWHLETGYEYQFIQQIVDKTSVKLHREQLYVGEQIIGHQSRIEEVMLLLDIGSCNTVCMMGIHGAGGMGKTTLAKAIYNLIADQFEFAIFLESVRERSNGYMGLAHLQETILSKLFEGRNIMSGSVSEGAANLKDRLRQKKVLLVLDDVDSEDQLEKLAGKCHWCGLGSRIIITTRDKHVLNVCKVEKRYEMKELNDYEALQLFCWNAFKMSQPAIDYEDVSNRVVRYANGLPLALKVIGSNLVSKSVEDCECAMEQYERILERKIHDILKISYDCLPDNAKYIFLDIACFFKWECLQFVEQVMERCDFCPKYNIGILVDKSMLTVENGRLRMHDLIHDMGREIVRQEAPLKPGERSRLYYHEDVLRVLTENLGSGNIEGIILNPPEEEEVEWNGTAFEKMNNLRILVVRNARFSSGPYYLPNSLRMLDWKGYPSESLPPGFYPRNLVDLSLPHSHLNLGKEKSILKLKHLTCINFVGCEFITHLPDLSGVPNLRKLWVAYCKNLIAVHHSVGFLKKLEHFSALYCTKLEDFLQRMWLPSLQYLDLFETNIAMFPEIDKRMDKPLEIVVKSDQIKELPDSVDNLTGLTKMYIESKRLRRLPNALFMLPDIEKLILRNAESFTRFQNSHVRATTGSFNLNKPHYSPLRRLYFSRCGLTDEDLHVILNCFPNLEELEISGNNFVSLPTGIKESAELRYLDVSNCVNLKEIPELPSSIQEVHANGCPSLSPAGSSMLWSPALNEVYRLWVIMPQTPIPLWFHYRCKGGVVSFWGLLECFPLFR